MSLEDILLPLEKSNTNTNSVLISIDLEDFTYDCLRSLGKKPSSNTFALDAFYKTISNFIECYLPQKKLTFFTTGTLAREYPDLIKTLSNDGHEIASHYNFHDLMFDQSIRDIEFNIESAKESIFKACGKPPLGFRAPSFSIQPFNWGIFRLISKYFKYDSSFVLHQEHIQEYKKSIKNEVANDFYEFPIVTKKYLNKFNIKSGGTFFRLFPSKILHQVIDHNLQNDFVPQIYLHPYDLLTQKEFLVSYKNFHEFENKFWKSSFRYLRQYQWLALNNKSALNKLALITKCYNHLGRFDQLI